MHTFLCNHKKRVQVHICKHIGNKNIKSLVLSTNCKYLTYANTSNYVTHTHTHTHTNTHTYIYTYIYIYIIYIVNIYIYIYCKYLGEIKLKNLRLKVSCYYNLQVNNDVTIYSLADVHDIIIFTNN